MSDKSKLYVIFLLPLLIIVGWYAGNYALWKYDAAFDGVRLEQFAHRIADTDHIVATYSQSSVSLTVTGDNAKKVVRAVSSAKSDRPPLGHSNICRLMAKATFFKGTNVLDNIEMCSSLFLISHGKCPYRDDTGLLKAVVFTPIVKASEESWDKKHETK